MEKYFNIIKSVALFKTISEHEIKSMLTCLKTKTISYKKDDILLMEGDKPEYIGLVLEGQLHIVKDDFDGNRTLIAALMPGDIFAEALCCANISESPVTVLAHTECTVMLFQFSKILNTCPNSCVYHSKIIENMVRMIAEKNLFLQKRLEIITLKSIRAKILQYLETFSVKQGKEFIIPVNREKMAEYLAVDRSALSHELMKMKQDGILEYQKNKFKIKLY